MEDQDDAQASSLPAQRPPCLADRRLTSREMPRRSLFENGTTKKILLVVKGSFRLSNQEPLQLVPPSPKPGTPISPLDALFAQLKVVPQSPNITFDNIEVLKRFLESGVPKNLGPAVRKSWENMRKSIEPSVMKTIFIAKTNLLSHMAEKVKCLMSARPDAEFIFFDLFPREVKTAILIHMSSQERLLEIVRQYPENYEHDDTEHFPCADPDKDCSYDESYNRHHHHLYMMSQNAIRPPPYLNVCLEWRLRFEAEFQLISLDNLDPHSSLFRRVMRRRRNYIRRKIRARPPTSARKYPKVRFNNLSYDGRRMIWYRPSIDIITFYEHSCKRTLVQFCMLTHKYGISIPRIAFKTRDDRCDFDVGDTDWEHQLIGMFSGVSGLQAIEILHGIDPISFTGHDPYTIADEENYDDDPIEGQWKVYYTGCEGFKELLMIGESESFDPPDAGEIDDTTFLHVNHDDKLPESRDCIPFRLLRNVQRGIERGNGCPRLTESGTEDKFIDDNKPKISFVYVGTHSVEPLLMGYHYRSELFENKNFHKTLDKYGDLRGLKRVAFHHKCRIEIRQDIADRGWDGDDNDVLWVEAGVIGPTKVVVDKVASLLRLFSGADGEDVKKILARSPSNVSLSSYLSDDEQDETDATTTMDPDSYQTESQIDSQIENDEVKSQIENETESLEMYALKLDVSHDYKVFAAFGTEMWEWKRVFTASRY